MTIEIKRDRTSNMSQPFVSRRLGQQNANFVQRANRVAQSDQQQLDRQEATVQQAQALLDRTQDLTANIPRFEEPKPPSKLSQFLDRLKFWKYLPDVGLNRTDDTPIFTPRSKRIIAYAAGTILLICIIIFVSYVLAQARPPKPTVVVEVLRNPSSNATRSHDPLIDQLETDMSDKLQELSTKVAQVHKRENALRIDIETTEKRLDKLVTAVNESTESAESSENVTSDRVDWSKAESEEHDLEKQAIELSQRVEQRVREKLEGVRIGEAE